MGVKQELTRYCLSGAAGLVGWELFHSWLRTHLWAMLSLPISAVGGLYLSFLLNKYWTFGRNSGRGG